MKRSDVPVKHALPFAMNGSRNAIPETGTAAGAASLTKGFPDETMTPIIAGGTPPDGKDMNGVLYELSAMGRWANAGAEYSYDEAFSTSIGGYPRGARLLGSDGVTVFVSMSDDNTADPEAISASWEGYNPGRSTIALTAGIRILTALEAASSIIALTGTLTGNVQLVFPVWVREWEVINLTSGAFTVTCRTSSGGVVADKGFVTRLYGDGAVLNTWSEVDVEGMVKTVNDNGPDEHGNVKLGTAANADVTTSATDTTAGRVVTPGWMGFGGTAIDLSDADLLAKLPPGSCLFRQSGSVGSNHFGTYGAGIHTVYDITADNVHTANTFVDSDGQFTVEWLTIKRADGTVVSQRTQKLYGPLNPPPKATPETIFNGSVAIGDAQDLNNYTNPGLYYQPSNAQAATGKNYPEAVAGSLEVYKHAGMTQIYRTYNNSRHYIRTYFSTVWTAWVKQYDTANPPPVADLSGYYTKAQS
ncbi:hypothetical protein MMB25_22780, partial [Salmonella enterica]|nr:hypothetical protein [Salmonella enterica]MCH5744728.1 hypothetical protein [Salmonella enterica]MCH5749687.1 hypothetical protein [Salmonella enterica]MCH5757179.1 hypothetical protein [Salmonella enterica]MCH5770134.1 hypothetical protein [Salmonella enterica]